MLNYRTSEIWRLEFNSAHSGNALVASIVSDRHCEPRYRRWTSRRMPRRLHRCWCAPRRRSLPQWHLSPPTCRHWLAELSIIACYATLIGRRYGSDGRFTSINGRWLIVARARAYWSRRIFSEAPSATSGVNPPRLSRDFKRVRGDHTDRPSESMHDCCQ